MSGDSPDVLPDVLPLASPLESLRAHVQGVISQHNLNTWTPEGALSLMRKPTFQLFTQLNRKLQDSDQEWGSEFIKQNGLRELLAVVDSATRGSVSRLCDTVMVLECVACIRTLLNSKYGIQSLICDQSLTRTLFTALSTNSITVKEEVVAILAAVCVYSNQGRMVVLNALQYYKEEHCYRYRFSFIISELSSPDIPDSYAFSLISFVNCLIGTGNTTYDRNRIRNAFIGLNILDHLHRFRARSTTDDVLLQCDMFYESYHKDQSTTNSNQSQGEGQDSSDLDAIFTTLKEKTYNKPEAAHLTTILMNMMMFEVDSTDRASAWSITEELTTDVVSTSNSEHILEAWKVRKNNKQGRCDGTSERECEEADTRSTNTDDDEPHEGMSNGTPSKPTDDASTSGQPPSTAPPPPPPPPPAPPGIPPPPAGGDTSNVPTMIDHKPSKKMKTVNWKKINTIAIEKHPNSIWTQVETMDDVIRVDYDDLEELFCKEEVHSDDETGSDGSHDHVETSVFSIKRSMIINIFLAQFKRSVKTIVTQLARGDFQIFTTERLKTLKKVLPEEDELHLLESYEGDTDKLEEAEQFVLGVISIPNYSQLIEALIFTSEFYSVYDNLRSDLNSLEEAGCKILDDKSLPMFIRYVLHSGNFINAGSYGGRAAGFTYTSLLELSSLRSSRNGVSLLLYLVSTAEHDHPAVLEFSQTCFDALHSCERLQFDELQSSMNQLNNQLVNLEQLPMTLDKELHDLLESNIQEYKTKMQTLEEKRHVVSELSAKLAEYFCVERSKFKIGECLHVLLEFVENVNQCRKENKETVKRKKRMEKRRKNFRKSKEISKENDGFDTTDGVSRSPTFDNSIIDTLLSEIRSGVILRSAS